MNVEHVEVNREDDFDAWLRSVSPESFEDGAEIDASWLGWFRRVFDERGPIDREQLDARAREQAEATVATAPWTRLADDVRRTTGRELELDVTSDEARGWLDVAVSIDGRRAGSIGRSYCLADSEELLAELTENLREFALDEEIWGGWPTCPMHHTHPLEARVVREAAWWQCPVLNRPVARIGDLAEIG